MKLPKGIYYQKKSQNYRVRRFNMHIGCYPSLGEAIAASEKAEEEYQIFKYKQQWLDSKRKFKEADAWLKERGLL